MPWRDRPPSFLRGHVLGSMTAWPVAAVFLVLFLWTRSLWMVAFAVAYAAVGAMGTYMWRHG